MSARTECYLPVSRRGMKLRHLGIDPFHVVIASHRDAVVAVCDEVRVADLVQAHGWQLLAPVEGPIYPLPPLPHARLRGQEDRVELRASTDAARYLLHPHHPPSDANPAHRTEFLPEVLEAGQPVGGEAVPQTGHQPPEARPPAGAGEVRIYLLFEAHVSNHCQTPSLNRTPATPVRRARGPQVRSA